MSTTTAPTSLKEVQAMTETERRAWNREFYLPSTRVWTAKAPDGTEQIYIGRIESSSVYDSDRDTQFQIEDYVCPPKPMDVSELLDWINTAPHGLQIRLDATLPDALNGTVEVIEAYPPSKLTVVRQQ
jgi:hypothetical protein